MSAATITATPCQPNIGAEIGGVDLSKPITEDIADAIRSALLKYQVIVLRDQHITREQHKDFARIFVKNTESPFTIPRNQANPIPDYPEILNLMADGIKKTAADVWHSDECFRVWPAVVSVLRGRVVPSLGGDTVFSSAVAAYENLPDDVKQKIRDLKALNSPLYLFANASQAQLNTAGPQGFAKQVSEFPPLAQPIVRIHPETKKPVLYVNKGYSGVIVGMEGEEGSKLLAYLCDQAVKPDYQFRVRWKVDTIVVWDNRSVQHYAVADYSEPRVMERFLVAGNEPAYGFSDLHEKRAPENAA